MTCTLSLKELRPELPNVIKKIDEQFDRFIVTKRGKPVVVMMSIDEYESIMETLGILEDKETLRRIRKGEKEIQSGKTRPWEEVRHQNDKV